METFLRRTGIYIIAIVLTVSFFLVNGFFNNKKSEIIKADGMGYYSYLPSIFIYGDFSQKFMEDKISKYYSDTGLQEYIDFVDGKPVNKYFIGTTVLMYPFFISAHWLAVYFNQPTDGFSVLYQYIAGLGAIFYVFIGIYFLSRLLRLYKTSEVQIFFICSLIVFGTNLFFYSVDESTMSHAYSFAAIAAFLFYSKSIIENKEKKHIIPVFISIALIILIRPFNMIILLALPFLAGSMSKLKDGFKFIFSARPKWIIGFVLAAIIISLQSIIWYIQTGHFIVYSYMTERFYFNKPHLFNVLFSYRKGIFIYTPLTFLAIAGTLFYFRKKLFEIISFGIFFLILIYIMSCWHEWYYGGSFGFRPLIEFYPLFAILILFILQSAGKMVKTTFGMLFLFAIYVNQVQAYQYRNYILHWHLMSDYKYWKVFLKTGSEWKGYVWNNPEPDDLDGERISTFENNFEQPSPDWNNGFLKDIGTNALSGKMAAFVDDSVVYSNTLILRNGKLTELQRPAIAISGFIHPNEDTGNTFLQLVVSYDNKEGSTYFYKSRLVDNIKRGNNGWRKFEIGLVIDKLQASTDIVKVYFWNPDKKSYWIDDVKIQFIELKK